MQLARSSGSVGLPPNARSTRTNRLGEIKERAARTEMLRYDFVFNTTLDSKRAVYLAMSAPSSLPLFDLGQDRTAAAAHHQLGRRVRQNRVGDIASKQLTREALDQAPQTIQGSCPP